MIDAILPEIRLAVQHAQRILVASHIRPDGDAVGSVLGLGLALQSAGKEVQMILEDGVPSSFKRLPGADQILRRPGEKADLAIVLDCSDLDRVGNALQGETPGINIDHHPTNLNFAGINLVDPEAVSTTEILAGLIRRLDLPLTKSVGEALLTGLITDTLGFRTPNMTSKVMRLAADLMDLGVDMPTLYFQTMIQRSFMALKFWGTGLSHLQREGRLVWATLTLQDRKAIGYPGRDDADLINLLTTINDSDITLIFIEQQNHKVKVSWRARPGFDTSQIALNFGGGGHKVASGAEIPGTLQEVQAKVLQATRQLLEENTHGESLPM